MRESISYSPWRRMAIPIATGSRRNDWVDTICSALTHTGALSVSVRVSREEAMVSRYKTATTAPPVASHFSCRRSMPCERRKRRTRPTAHATMQRGSRGKKIAIRTLRTG